MLSVLDLEIWGVAGVTRSGHESRLTRWNGSYCWEDPPLAPFFGTCRDWKLQCCSPEMFS